MIKQHFRFVFLTNKQTKNLDFSGRVLIRHSDDTRCEEPPAQTQGQNTKHKTHGHIRM